MMSLKLQIILACALIAGLAGIIHLVKKRALELKYVLTWIFCDIALLIMVLIPGAMEDLALFLGISSPMNMIFFLGFIFSIGLIFSLTVTLSRTTGQLRELAQAVALRPDEKADGAEDE